MSTQRYLSGKANQSITIQNGGVTDTAGTDEKLPDCMLPVESCVDTGKAIEHVLPKRITRCTKARKC